MKILYLSHGENATGGYYLERDLCTSIGDYKEVRFAKNYRGFFAWCLLFVRAFFAAKADVVVTVARLAWPVYLRNLFNRSKIILVLHNYDRNDGKPALYYKLLDWFLANIARNKNKLALVVVADFWRNFFQKNWHIQENIFTFPNTFDVEYMKTIGHANTVKNAQIHCGQYSAKADVEFYREMVKDLESRGYKYYFSSHIPMKVLGFNVVYFDSHEAYLKQMAESHCTVIINGIAEGWNRVAHESFLVGTQVISNGKGGIGELVSLANGYTAKSKSEVLQIIDQENFKNIHIEALEKFDISQKDVFSQPIKSWLQGA